MGGYMFITSPHQGPNGLNFSGTPHSASRFLRKAGAEASRPRESFEFRCLLIDTTWTNPAKLFAGTVPQLPMDQQLVQSSADSLMAVMLVDLNRFITSMEDTDDMIVEKRS